MNHRPIRSILIANRSEIAIRVMRAASEMRIGTIAIYSQQDRQALHRFKADESYLVGEGKKPLAAYLDGEDILRIARSAGADAIHPGYGFLSENAAFAEAVIKAGLIYDSTLWLQNSANGTPQEHRLRGYQKPGENKQRSDGIPVRRIGALGAPARPSKDARNPNSNMRNDQ